MNLQSKIRFFCPLIALFSCIVLMLQVHALLSAPIIGLAAFLLVQWLYNTTKLSRHPDGSKELERMTAAQMNDPALPAAVTAAAPFCPPATSAQMTSSEPPPVHGSSSA